MRRAFTLVELLVVLGIVAVLAAILFPVFARAKAAAKATSCLSNLRQVGFAFLMYEGDHDGMTVPPHYFNDVDAFVHTDIQYWYARAHNVGAKFTTDVRESLLQPYLKGPLLTSCPAASFDLHDGMDAPLAYGLNYDLQRVVFETDARGKRQAYQTGVKMGELEAPAETVLFADSGASKGDRGDVSPEAELYGPSDPHPKHSNVHGRHGGLANVAWTDGHARAMRVSFVSDSEQGRTDKANDLGDLVAPRFPFDGCAKKTASGACAEDFYFLLAKPRA